MTSEVELLLLLFLSLLLLQEKSAPAAKDTKLHLHAMPPLVNLEVGGNKVHTDRSRIDVACLTCGGNGRRRCL